MTSAASCFCPRKVPLTHRGRGHHEPGKWPGRVPLGEPAVNHQSLIKHFHFTIKCRDLNPLLRLEIVLFSQQGQTTAEFLMPTLALQQRTLQEIQFHLVRSGMRELREFCREIRQLTSNILRKPSKPTAQTSHSTLSIRTSAAACTL